jgi:hypothetical protein
MLGRALYARDGSPPEALDPLFDVRAISSRMPETPTISFSHDDWPQHKRPSQLATDKAGLYAGKTVIVLIRDPRDALVSNYFQLTRREGRGGRFASLSDYLTGDVGGADSFVAFYNIWWANRAVPSRFLVVRYEDLLASPAAELRRVFTALELDPVADEFLERLAAWGSFENLRSLAMRSAIHELAPADAADLESYKFRRAGVGGHADYLTESDLRLLDEKVARLSDAYGYC